MALMDDDGARPRRRRRHQLLVAALIGGVPAAVLVAIRLGNEGDQLERTLAQLLFWAMPFVLAFVVTCLWLRSRAASSQRGIWLRQAAPGVAFAIGLTLLLFWLVPPQLRVQFDETSLVGVSQNMQRLDAAMMTTGAIPYQGEVLPLENTVDKRPPLFAFLVHLVHRAVGYRIANAFFVNGAMLALGLAVAFQAARARLGRPAAWAAPLLLMAVPLTGVTATSAGFELMATVWFFVALLAAADFVRTPDDARFAGLLAAGMLFAQSRYESLPAALLLAAIVWWRVRGRFRPSFVGATLLALCPALMLPLGFLLLHAQNPKFYPEAGGAPLLASEHLFDHVGPLLSAWFDLSLANALPGVLAVMAVLVWGLRLWRRQVTGDDVMFAAPVLGVTVLALAWFYGDVREQTAWRLFLPLAWATALVPLAAFGWLRRRAAVAMVVLLAGLAVLRGRELVLGRAFPELQITALTGALDRLVERLPGDRTKTLWVSSAAQYLIVRGYAALSPAGFERRLADLQQLRRRGDLRVIYLLETTIDDAMAPALGSPRELLQRYPGPVVERVGGAMPITVHQLAR